MTKTITRNEILEFFIDHLTNSTTRRLRNDIHVLAQAYAYTEVIVTVLSPNQGYDHWRDREIASIVIARKPARENAYSLAKSKNWIEEKPKLNKPALFPLVNYSET